MWSIAESYTDLDGHDRRAHVAFGHVRFSAAAQRQRGVARLAADAGREGSVGG